ncbi:6958_t:CDS:1, partial [Racocetra persica]
KWKCGRPATMESHLALHCKGDIPDNLRHHYLIKVAKQNNKINDDSDNESTLLLSTKPRSYCKPISSKKVNEINKALFKAFVCTRIAFSVIDNPFVHDLFHLLEPGWVPPGRVILSERILNEEAARITIQMDSLLDKAENLTL